MPTLDWIGKKAVVNHHRQVPYRLIHCDKDKSVGDPDAGNLLVQGDNLEALKALLPYYAGKVKCIYIDPPYNTGNEAWVYNDNVNSPEIKAWLGATVGKEAEDLSRHDKWLCMMYPRLRLLKEFLSEDGSIWISIDDNEFPSLRLVCDEIFKRNNFIATVIWHKMDSPKNSAIHLSEDHEYIALYAKNASIWRPKGLQRSPEMIARYKNPDNDPRGPWLLSDLAARNFYAQGRYPIETASGKIIEGPPAGSFWRVSREKFDELDRDNRIWWGKSGTNRPGIKRFLSEVKDSVVPQTYWHWKDVGSTRNSKQEFSKLVDAGKSEDLFITPKPTKLIQRIIEIAADDQSIILDSFLGSGTTAHSVIEANRADGGKRRFIGCEMDDEVVQTATLKRLGRVLESGSDEASSVKEGFRFCTLGEPLFDADGNVSEAVTFPDLAAHIFFCDTGSPIPRRADGSSPLIGTFQGRAIYLLFNRDVMGFPKADAGNVLTASVLESLPLPEPGFTGPRVVYAEGCTVPDDRLASAGVSFRQVPYQIEGM
jgi:site-specific DNA-methyltransferase (adenine-specific)/adenine-specific DNA-methyltransferase